MKPLDREALAAVQHKIWSHWMSYLFGCCTWKNGAAIIPREKVDRWTRQMIGTYADLPEQEKESDRCQADKVIASITGK